MTQRGMTSPSGVHSQKRADSRKPVKHSAILHYNGTQIPVVLFDLSRGGARVGYLAGRTAMVLDGPVTLEVPGSLRLPVSIRWQNSTGFGVSFELPAARKATCQQQIDRIIARAGR